MIIPVLFGLAYLSTKIKPKKPEVDKKPKILVRVSARPENKHQKAVFEAAQKLMSDINAKTADDKKRDLENYLERLVENDNKRHID